MITTKYYSFQEISSSEYAPGEKGHSAAQLMLMYRKATEQTSPAR